MKKLILPVIILMGLQTIHADASQDFLDAVRANNMQAMEQALKNGANLKTHGFKALMVAAIRGNEPLFDRLVSLKVSMSPAQVNDNNMNLLMQASIYGQTNIINKLLRTGAYNAPVINAQDNIKMTALMRAAHYGRHEAILLLASVPGINKSIQCSNDTTPDKLIAIDFFFSGLGMYRYQRDPKGGYVRNPDGTFTEVPKEEQNRRKAAIINALKPKTR